MTKSIILIEIDLTLTKYGMYQNMHRQGMLGRYTSSLELFSS